ncbi:MAG: exodeoxyribonuclease VII small subunit [Spirochaetales bacterium]|nr:exodeoxyribonuclease VII small subunit [Spirochaetales bacterium]
MKSFEERLERLEKITAELKSNETPLTDALAQFEEGVKLARSLEKDLEKMEKKVEVLLSGQENPSAEAEPNFELFSDLPE